MLTKTIKESREQYESITRNELRQLLFWANYGWKQCKKKRGSGSFSETIESTIKEYCDLVKYNPT